jgi:hypothetical protein
MKREFRIKPNHVTPCPECGNTEEFFAHSERCAEDCCETWISCKCGHAPPSEHRRECVFGDISKEAIGCLMQDREQWLKELA